MQIVIDIPEEHYRTLQDAIKNHMESLIGKIILNGTVLPEHGRLFYADTFVDGRYTHIVPIDNAPTILDVDMIEPQESGDKE